MCFTISLKFYSKNTLCGKQDVDYLISLNQGINFKMMIMQFKSYIDIRSFSDIIPIQFFRKLDVAIFYFM